MKNHDVFFIRLFGSGRATTPFTPDNFNAQWNINNLLSIIPESLNLVSFAVFEKFQGHGDPLKMIKRQNSKNESDVIKIKQSYCRTNKYQIWKFHENRLHNLREKACTKMCIKLALKNIKKMFLYFLLKNAAICEITMPAYLITVNSDLFNSWSQY